MKNATISIIIPVFNAERYLAEAIESVLMQSVKPLEIIVVNDGSTDKSEKVANTFKNDICYLLQENKGASAARNLGISLAKGSLLAFLDADDVWTAHKLELQLKALKKNPELDMVFGNVEQFVSPELDAENGNRLRSELKIMPGYYVGTMLIKRESFQQVGLFKEDLQLAEFIDWFSRAEDMKLHYKVLPEVVTKRRIHTTNQGLYKRQHMKDYVSVLKAALDRRRAANKTNINKAFP